MHTSNLLSHNSAGLLKILPQATGAKTLNQNNQLSQTWVIKPMSICSSQALMILMYRKISELLTCKFLVKKNVTKLILEIITSLYFVLWPKEIKGKETTVILEYSAKLLDNVCTSWYHIDRTTLCSIWIFSHFSYAKIRTLVTRWVCDASKL